MVWDMAQAAQNYQPTSYSVKISVVQKIVKLKKKKKKIGHESKRVNECH